MCKYCVLSVMVLLMFISFVKADLTDGLVLWLPFEEGAGEVVHDLSLNEIKGDIMGDPEWVEGKYDNALRFGGGGDRVEVPWHDAFDITEALTMSLWAARDTMTGRPHYAILNASKNKQGPWGFNAWGKGEEGKGLSMYYYFKGRRTVTVGL